MRRFIVSLFALAMVVPTIMAGAVVGPNDVIGPIVKPAYACGNDGMHQVAYTAAGNTDVLGQNASTDITAYQDYCGNQQERYSVWSRTGSQLTNVAITMRLWQCNFNFQTIHVVASVAWTGWYPGGGCGNRADDVGSSGTTACTSAACYNSNSGGVFYDTIWQ